MIQEKDPSWLYDFRSDAHSQSGEDGVISKILEMLPTTDKWRVEFGACDGEHLSSTCHLIESKGYSAVLIEGNPAKCGQLKDRFRSNRNVFATNAMVGWKGGKTLDHLLEKTSIPKTFDLLSVDIDGNDYYV